MICKNCNAEIDNSSAFCINCGTPVETEPAQPVYQPQPEQPVYQQQYQPQGGYQQQPAYQAQPVYQQPLSVITALPQPLLRRRSCPLQKSNPTSAGFLFPASPLSDLFLRLFLRLTQATKTEPTFSELTLQSWA